MADFPHLEIFGYRVKCGRCTRFLWRTLGVALLIFVAGCTFGSYFVFRSTKEVAVTPAKYGIPYEDVWFSSGDGKRLNGWLIPGKNTLPPLVFFHGNGGNLSDNLQYINLLHNQGFSIFIFDYRGYGKSRGRPMRDEDFYADARGALKYLDGRGWRRERMIFYGQSLGGAVALQMALECRPVGLVMESSFTSMKEMARYTAPVPYYTLFIWCLNLGFDNLAKVKDIRVPLFIIHGDKDAVAPVQMARRLFAKASQPKMLHIIYGGGHCDVFERQGACPAYLQAWSRFLDVMKTKSRPVKTAKIPRG